MDTDNIPERLVVEARRRLAEGAAPIQVFTQIAENESDLREVAYAVCLAINIPRSEVDQRLEGISPTDWNPDDEESPSREDVIDSLAIFLDAVGTFDPHVELSSDQRRIIYFLGGAVTEMGQISSGWAATYGRKIHAGRLHEAFVLLSQPARMGREVSTRTYWARMVEAAEMIDIEGDADYVDAVQRCRDRLAQCR